MDMFVVNVIEVYFRSSLRFIAMYIFPINRREVNLVSISQTRGTSTPRSLNEFNWNETANTLVNTSK